MDLILISDKSYIISVSFGSGCYRHIKIPESYTLFDLHKAILNAFHIDDDHAHAFFLDNYIWSDLNAYFDGFYRDINRRTKDYRLDKVMFTGQKFKYLFDFGAELVFQCRVIRETDEILNECSVVRRRGVFPITADKVHQADKIDIPHETMQNIFRYFNAFASLYGIISIDKAFEIYNMQNDAVSRDAFTRVSEIAAGMENDYIIYENSEIINRDLLAESICSDNHDYIELKKLQADKPFYIPDKETLLKQTDETYCERDIYFDGLVEFLKNETDLSENDADEAADKILFLCSRDEDMNTIIPSVYKMGIHLKNINSEDRLYSVVITLKNNTRLWSNRGYTTVELNAGK